MFFLSKAKVCNEFLTVETIEHGKRRVVAAAGAEILAHTSLLNATSFSNKSKLGSSFTN